MFHSVQGRPPHTTIRNMRKPEYRSRKTYSSQLRRLHSRVKTNWDFPSPVTIPTAVPSMDKETPSILYLATSTPIRQE